MANAEDIKILQKGVEEWNARRRELSGGYGEIGGVPHWGRFGGEIPQRHGIFGACCTSDSRRAVTAGRRPRVQQRHRLL